MKEILSPLSKVFGSLFIALTWTIFIQVLLCLPGHSFPSTESFSIPGLDKIAHIIIFGILVFSWCAYLNKKAVSSRQRATYFFIVFLGACANGIIIEYIQKYYIPNRSFDLGDIIADILSSGVAYGLCNVVFSSAQRN